MGSGGGRAGEGADAESVVFAPGDRMTLDLAVSRPCWVVLLVALRLLYPEPGRCLQPYQPARLDPALEAWRWQSFPEMEGAGLRCLTKAKWSISQKLCRIDKAWVR